MSHLLLQRIIIWWYKFWSACMCVCFLVFMYTSVRRHIFATMDTWNHIFGFQSLFSTFFWRKIILSFSNTYAKVAIKRVSPISKSFLPSCHTVLALKTNTITSIISWVLESRTQTLALTQKTLYITSRLTIPTTYF